MADGDRFQYKTVAGTAVTFVMPLGTRHVRVINIAGDGNVYVSLDGLTPTVAGNFRVITAAIGSSRLCDIEAGATQTDAPKVICIADSSTTVAVEVA
jgi:hypothetical protein